MLNKVCKYGLHFTHLLLFYVDYLLFILFCVCLSLIHHIFCCCLYIYWQTLHKFLVLYSLYNRKISFNRVFLFYSIRKLFCFFLLILFTLPCFCSGYFNFYIHSFFGVCWEVESFCCALSPQTNYFHPSHSCMCQTAHTDVFFICLWWQRLAFGIQAVGCSVSRSPSLNSSAASQSSPH